MNFTTQQLQYLVEIERTRSISQASANLFVSQPNLSRMLGDLEESLGYTIFERTRKGVHPTQKGEQFLRHARNILRESEFMEQLGPNCHAPNRFRICLPRSYGWLDVTRKFLAALPSDGSLNAQIRECHPRQALEMLEGGSVEIALIRFAVGYQDYFAEQAQARQMALKQLSQLEYQIVCADTDSLAKETAISKDQLESRMEILHRDRFYPDKDTPNGIYTIDRLAQLQLVQHLPGAYFWAEPLPEALLAMYHLVQRPCRQGGGLYQNALVYKPQCAMSAVEKDFLDLIQKQIL